MGFALEDISKKYKSNKLSLYGFTASRFYTAAPTEKDKVSDRMLTHEDNLIFGDISHIDSTIQNQSRLKGVPPAYDIIYSYASLSYTERPLLHLLKKIYKVTAPNGLAFLHNGLNTRLFLVKNRLEIDRFLEDNGYQFEIEWGDHNYFKGWSSITRCSFRKTHDRLRLPLCYNQQGWATLEH